MEKKRFQFKEHPWISIAVLLFLYLVTDVLSDLIRRVLKPDAQMIIAQDSVKGAKQEVVKGKGFKGVLTDLRDIAVMLVQIWAAALLIVVLCFLFWWAVSPSPGITVLPFENNTGSPDYDGMGTGIVDSLIAELQDIGRIHMIEARDPKEVRTIRAEKIELPIMGGGGAVKESLKDMGDISAGEVNVPVGSLLATIKTLFSSSGQTISGSIQKYGSTIRIVARLDKNGRESKAWQVSGPASSGSELTALIEELAFKMCMCRDLSKHVVTAHSWESFKHFTYGLENSHRYELSEGAEDAYAYKAIRNYEDAIAIQPRYAIAHYNLGAIYYDLGQCGDEERYHKATCEKAIEEYEKATEANPDFKDAYYYLGVAYYTPFFNREMAIKNYSRMINLDPSYAKAYRNRAAIYVELKNYNKALEDFGHLIESNGEDKIEAYLSQGSIYREKAGSEQAEPDDLLRAVESFSETIELDPNLSQAYYNRGCTYTDLEQYPKAIDDLSQAITLTLSYVEAYNARGAAYSAQGEHGKAVEDFSRATELDPTNPQTYKSRADAYRCLGDTKTITGPVKADEYYRRPDYYRKAVADYSTAISLDPTASFFYYDRGVCRKSLWQLAHRWAKKAEEKAAIQDFQKFLELQEDPRWRVRAGDELRELQGKKTIAELSSQIQDEPDHAEAFYERAMAYLEVEVYKKAIPDFDQIVKLEPEHAQAYLQRGIAYTKLDPPQEEQAIADFERVIEINSAESKAYLQRGLSYERQAQVHDQAKEFEKANIAYTKAITDFSQVINIDPQNGEAYRHREEDHYRMGQIYARISDDPSQAKAKDRFDLAIKDLTDFIKFTTAITDVVWARNLRGLSYFEVEEYESAITDFSKAIDLQPNAFLYYNRGNVYYKQEQYKLAIDEYDEAIQRNPNVADFYYQRGSAHEFVLKDAEIRRDRRKNAIRDLEKAARLGYDVPEEQLRRLREGAKSIAELDQTIANDPENADAYYLRGLARAGQGQYQSAIEDFTRVIELQPGYAEALYNRGLVYSHLNQYQEAVYDFTTADKLGIKDIELYRHRGQAHLALEKRSEAIADFTQVITGNPTDVEAHYYLGIACIELEDYSQAFANFDRAIELDDLDARAYNGLGIAHTKLEDYPQAIDYLNQAIKLDPAYVEAYYNRGIAHKLQGNNKEATRDFESEKITQDPYWQGLAQDQLEELPEQ